MDDNTFFKLRARSCANLYKYLIGETDKHPEGLSGARWIIPGIEDSKILFMDFDGEYGSCGLNEYEVIRHNAYYHAQKPAERKPQPRSSKMKL